MKTIKLKNNEVVPVFNFLQELELVGQASRGRTKFNKRLEEKNKEFNEDLAEIRKDYFESNEAGELVVEENTFVYKEGTTDEQKAELVERVKELENEEVEVSFAEYSKKYEALFSALDELDIPLKGQEAFAYDQLMTAYEENEEEK